MLIVRPNNNTCFCLGKPVEEDEKMSEDYCIRTDAIRIIESLPLQEIKHMRRVGTHVGILASKIPELNRMDYGAEYFGEAASYHDIGKAWVPRSLLTKPGKFTKEEVAVMKMHPVYARELFDRINNGSVTGISKHIFQLFFDSAVYHQEWWNGEGYPYGISFNSIPLIARITSVCDAYDAITNERAYRAARTHYDACRELEENAGTQFDPEIVRIFLNHENEFLTSQTKCFPDLPKYKENI